MTAWVKARGAINRGAGAKTGSAEAIPWRAAKQAKIKKIPRFERSLENPLVKNDSLWCCFFSKLPFGGVFLEENRYPSPGPKQGKDFFSNSMVRNYNDKKGN
jgi:hypothetical protein